LQDYIGEDKLNQAIRTFHDAHAFKGPPYPSSEELVQRIREVTPPRLQYLVEDLFEKIVVYDNRAVSATMKPLAGAMGSDDEGRGRSASPTSSARKATSPSTT
jgi:hypothetical protein